MTRYHGIVNVYKEKGYTSHDVVAIIRKKFGGIKTGHTGTLDPDAEGVLPICVGRATKLAGYLTAADKAYRVELVLGITTDTYDSSGEIITKKDVEFTACEVREAVDFFVGGYMQVPPMHSAIKVGGKKLYKLARAGKTVERAARRVEIPKISVEHQNGRFWLDVECGKGTYIRSLCADIGERLGCGGSMGELTRTRSGIFSAAGARKLSRLANAEDYLIPIERAFPAPRGMLIKNAVGVMNGQPAGLPQVRFDGEAPKDGGFCWLYHEDTLVGLYILDKDTLRLEVMVHENG